MEDIKQFLVPMIVRRLLTLISGGLLAIGMQSETINNFVQSNDVTTMIGALVVVVVTFIYSLLSKKKAVNLPPPSSVK